MRIRYKASVMAANGWWPAVTRVSFYDAWIKDIDLPDREPCFGDPPR